MSAAAAARHSLRFAIGAILLATAAGKLSDIQGFVRVLQTYHAFPDRTLLPLALAIPLAVLARKRPSLPPPEERDESAA